jgi:hypothetical protein
MGLNYGSNIDTIRLNKLQVYVYVPIEYDYVIKSIKHIYNISGCTKFLSPKHVNITSNCKMKEKNDCDNLRSITQKIERKHKAMLDSIYESKEQTFGSEKFTKYDGP